MDEFRRLKATNPDVSSRELAEFQVFAKAVAAHREDGRGSEDRGGDNRGNTVMTSGGAGTALARTSRTPASAAPVTDLLRDSGGMRRMIVPALAQIYLPETADVHRRRKGKNQDRSAESASPSRSPAPEQSPAPSLPRPQDLVLSTVHHPAPSEPALENPPRSCQRFRPAPAREKTSIVNATRPWTPRA